MINSFAFSIDAERKLRDSKDNYSLIKTELYIKNFRN